MSKSSNTTTNPDWLHNCHAGELLASEFMEPIDLTAEALASAIGVDAVRIRAMIAGSEPVNGDLDLRLGR